MKHKPTDKSFGNTYLPGNTNNCNQKSLPPGPTNMKTGEHCFVFSRAGAVRSHVYEIETKLKELGLNIQDIRSNPAHNSFINLAKSKLLNAYRTNDKLLNPKSLNDIEIINSSATITGSIKPNQIDIINLIVSYDVSLEYATLMQTLSISGGVGYEDVHSKRATVLLVYEDSSKGNLFTSKKYEANGKFSQFKPQYENDIAVNFYIPELVLKEKGLDADKLSFKISEDETGITLAAYLNGQFVGDMTTAEALDINQHKSIILDRVEIKDEVKGKGLGTLLYLAMGELVFQKFKLPLKKSQLTTPEANNLWERLQQKLYAKVQVDQFGEVETEINLEQDPARASKIALSFVAKRIKP